MSGHSYTLYNIYEMYIVHKTNKYVKQNSDGLQYHNAYSLKWLQSLKDTQKVCRGNNVAFSMLNRA